MRPPGFSAHGDPGPGTYRDYVRASNEHGAAALFSAAQVKVSDGSSDGSGGGGPKGCNGKGRNGY